MNFPISIRNLPPPWRVEVKWSACLGAGAFGLLCGAAVSAVFLKVFSPSALVLGACFHIVASVAALGGLWWVKPRGSLAAKLGIRRPAGADVKAAVLGLLAVYGFIIAVVPLWRWVLDSLDVDYQETQELLEICAAADVPFFLYMLVLVGVVIPAAEELFFRRLLFGMLRPLGVVAALILTSVIFGALHGFLYGFWALTFFGAVLQWLYLRTGNLATGIIAHSVFNLVSLCVTFFLNGEE